MKSTLHFILDLFKKNRGLKTVSDDFNEAIGNEVHVLWQKVRPLFIKEDKSLIENIEKDPDNTTLQGGLEYLFEKKLENGPLKNEVQEFENKIKSKLSTPKNNIKSSGIVVSKGTVNLSGTYVSARDMTINNQKN